MKLRRKSRGRASLAAVMAAVALSISPCAVSGALAADVKAGTESAPGPEASSIRPPATFFTINAVLAKLDRQRGHGPNAVRTAALAAANTATDAEPEPKPAPAVGTEPFGLFTFRAPESILWRKWRSVESDLAKEHSVLERCHSNIDACPPHAAQFLRLIRAVGAKSGRDRLDEANRAVNQAIRYTTDFAQHGEADRWSAPLATFATGKGDCEDYAIAKYVALSEAGFPRDDLRLVLVRDRAVRQDHAVLAARLDGHWLILDSRRSDLLDDADATNLTPLFAINDRGVQLFAAPYSRRAPLDGEVDATPAAAGGKGAEWTGMDASESSGIELNALPLLI